MVVVKLDDERYGAGPGTVVANVATVDEYLKRVQGRDGAIDRRYRLWEGTFAVGARVSAGSPEGT